MPNDFTYMYIIKNKLIKNNPDKAPSHQCPLLPPSQPIVSKDTYFPAAQCSPKTIRICITWESDGEASSLIQPRSAESTPLGVGPRNMSGQAPAGSQACYTLGSIQRHRSPCPRGVNAHVLSQRKNSGVGSMLASRLTF